MEAIWTFWKAYVVELRVIEVCTLLFIAQQVFAIRAQTALDHERSRRLRALDDLRWFVDRLKPEHHRIAKVLDELPHDAIIAIRQNNSFKMSEAQKADVERILASRLQEKGFELKSENGFVSLSSSNVTTLRSITMDYLNLIEVVLAPLSSGVSHEGILKSQMRGYFFHEDGRPKCKSVREAWGERSLPSSFMFFKDLQKEEMDSNSRSKLKRLTSLVKLFEKDRI